MNNEQRTEEITVKVTRTAEGVTLTLPAEFASATVAVEPEPWKRWEPKKDEKYWVVDGTYKTIHCIGPGLVTEYIQFKTELLAERHAKRIRSMVPTCAMPKDGEEYWYVTAWDHPGLSESRGSWNSSLPQICLFHSGRVFLTKAAAENWIAEFGDVWTTRIAGEGE